MTTPSLPPPLAVGGSTQTIAQGPVAALEVIKNLGSNGRGFFNAEMLRNLRVLEVLEFAGTVEAKRMLEVLAQKTPRFRMTVEAKAALERLTKQP